MVGRQKTFHFCAPWLVLAAFLLASAGCVISEPPFETNEEVLEQGVVLGESITFNSCANSVGSFWHVETIEPSTACDQTGCRDWELFRATTEIEHLALDESTIMIAYHAETEESLFKTSLDGVVGVGLATWVPSSSFAVSTAGSELAENCDDTRAPDAAVEGVLSSAFLLGDESACHHRVVGSDFSPEPQFCVELQDFNAER